MLSLNENTLEFKGMGLFTTESEWIHPSVTEKTYELIYVVSGTVHLAEGDNFYSLKAGDWIILKPFINHRGFKESFGTTSFYWLHFLTDNIEMLIGDKYLMSDIKHDYMFKEMLHHSYHDNSSKIKTELLLAQILLNNTEKFSEENTKKITRDIFEWTRINASPTLKTRTVAEHFNYSEDHVTRLIKKEYGKGLKQLINDFLIEKAKGLLVNTNFSVKEIATKLEFEDINAFVKFYKYHENITPSQYRNSYNATHMNKK